MTNSAGTLRVCGAGHQYYKNSDCPVCPICEQGRKPTSGFLSMLPAPARRALENKGIATLRELSNFSKAEILGLHGMGPGSVPKLEAALKEESLSFREKED